MPAPARQIVIKPKPPKMTPSTRRTPAAPTPFASDNLSPEAKAHLHQDRAKRWGLPSAWAAEWFENAVRFCQTPDGRQQFEQWLRSEMPPHEVPGMIKAIDDPPRKRYGSFSGNADLWNLAGYELGVSDEAMKLFHNFTSTQNICSPPRTLPAVKRRRGESSTAYLTRMHESLLLGCKMPDIDWHEIRKIVTAQYDATRDTLEAWHTDIDFYTDVIKTRASTTVAITAALESHRRGPDAELTIEKQLRMDAYRSCLLLMHLALALWGRALELLEDLARRGLVTTSAVEREYRKDPHLKWRLVSVGLLSKVYSQKVASKLSTIFARLPAFRNYINSYRLNDGLLHLEMNRSYMATHPFQPDTVDELIVNHCTTPTISFHAYFQKLTEILEKNPKEAEKFTSNAWDEIGNICDINTFTIAFNDSSFGQALIDFTNLPMPREEEKIFDEEVCFINPSMLSPDTFPYTSFSQRYNARAEKVTHDIVNTWSNQIYDSHMSPDEFIWLSILDEHKPHSEPFHGASPAARHVLRIPGFDNMWLMTDVMMWEKARRLDPPGQPGLVARTFGLYDPGSESRPLYAKLYLARQKAQKAHLQGLRIEATKPEQAKRVYEPAFAVGKSVGQSGRSYVASQGAKEEKVKTRKEKDAGDTSQEMLLDDNMEEPELPDVLPIDFKLPKKVWKLFDRLLDSDTLDDGDQKKGQVRWGDFEKAMRRIGFDVIQTAGSSVRFDPPAKTARPITFHRPHPDSLLTPHMIKWVGGRLSRTYGWTAETFQRKEGEAQDGCRPVGDSEVLD